MANNTTTLYILEARDLENKSSYRMWSHSKLELIHHALQGIQDGNIEAKVYSVLFKNYGTNRQLLVHILNKNPVMKNTKIVWRGKTEQLIDRAPSISPVEK